MSGTDRLLAWYERNRRPLPWRERRDAYGIWVSEIMLQQTRVETVEPYFRAFLDRFPTLDALAAAAEEEVLAAWSGLGYYRRARQMWRAARQVVEQGGELPRSAEELEKLPGIGPYTAAAVASIAFDVPVPVLDGNVERVLSRYLASDLRPKSAAGRRRLLAAAAELLDPERPGDFNQALMELGARLCTPRRPNCARCPLGVGCAARAAGEPERFPPPVRPRTTRRERWTVVVVRHDGRLLMRRRAADAVRMAGLWELPRLEEVADPGAALEERYGGKWSLGEVETEVRHSITSRRLEISVRPARWLPDAAAETSDLAWIPEGRLTELPTTSMVAKVLAALEAGDAKERDSTTSRPHPAGR